MDEKTKEKIKKWQTYKDRQVLEDLIKKHNISALELLDLAVVGLQERCSSNLFGCSDIDMGEHLNEDADNIREYLGTKWPSCESLCKHHFCTKYNKLFVDTSLAILDKYENNKQAQTDIQEG